MRDALKVEEEMMIYKKKLSLITLMLFIAVVVAACSGGEETTVILAENPWDGSAANTAVAKILLEDEMSFPVEVRSLDEGATWPAMAAGDVHANLEQWPSGHGADIETYIDGGQIDDAGPLGVVGKIGWWLPTYMVEANPALATWEGFLDPAVAAQFSTAESGDSGQLLIGDPSYVSFEEHIINNLGMVFQVVTGGGEAALIAAVDSAFSREDPLLFYWWTPHVIQAKFDLTRIELPAVTDECLDAQANNPEAVDCDYPEDVLLKIVWPGLAEEAPEAYQFLQNFNYTNDDQVFMLGKIDEGMSVDEAAQAWIDENEDVWRAWIP
jgi:glycine betaine/proline transport system substrate-binding protein